jgi:AraC-like DNA-binding protein
VAGERSDILLAMGGFSTAGVAARDQFGIWCDAIAQRFGSGMIAKDPSAPFAATIDSSWVGNVAVNHISAEPVTVVHGVGFDLFNVGLLLEGNAVIAQRGRESRLGPNDLILCDLRYPYRLRFDDRFRQLVVSLDRKQLMARLPHADRRTALRVDGRIGAGRVAFSFFDALQTQASSLGTAEEALGECALDLVALAFGGEPLRAGPASAGGESILLTRIKAFIEAHLGASQLTPHFIAARHGISRRYLYGLFEAAGETVAGYVWQRRLARCRDALADPNSRHRNISEIAFQWGFNDASHFCRAFQRAFGMSPRGFRQAQLRSG